MKRRVRGTGSIETYTDSRGQVRYRARVVLSSGRRVPVGVCKTAREAEILLKGALERYRAGEAVDLPGVTVRQWGASFLDQRDEQGIRGIKTERNRWKNLVDASPLADVILAAVVRRDAKQWLAWLQTRRIKYKHAHSRNGKKLSRVTLQNALNLVRKAFDVALDDELVTVNPFAGVRLPRNPGRTHEPWTYLTPEEQEALVRSVPSAEMALVQFAIATGLRQGEQWSLRWEDVNHNHVVVRFGSEGQPTKSGKTRSVPLIGRAALVAMTDRPTRGLVFPAPHGGRRDKGEPPWWKDAVRDAGIARNVRWHDLRHTCASSLVAGWWGRKWSLEEVKGMLGHASITTTERYAHLAESEIQKAARETTMDVVGERGPPSMAGGTNRARLVDGVCEPARLVNHDMPAVVPLDSYSTLDGPEVTISKSLERATSGIRIPDLRFTKACDTVATARSSQRESPLPGVQDFAGPGLVARRDQLAKHSDSSGCEPRSSPAGDREEPALLCVVGCGRPRTDAGYCRPCFEERGFHRPDRDNMVVTAEVASHAGLSPMLLEASYRDVMERRAGR